MKEFEQKIGKENIILFHVSMFGEDGSHGNLFQSGKDDELLETIRSVCAKYPDVPITLEMADGTDIDKACVNFDRMMYAFSNMHRNGLFSDMLNDELKEFFENLFRVYAVPWTNMSRIQTHLSKVKSYVMENTPTNATGGMASVFGFTHDEDVINTALVRLKVYILYTRFCNLGKYLAEVYSKANYLSDKKEDFNRSMKYFMFYDYEIHQCVYTGVGYTFNMDFLPKRIEKVYRFYDRIDNVKSFKPDEQLECNYFAQMVEAIRNQINGKLSMFSLGKNFFPCFMKYYQEPVGNNFTLRIYENMAVNYVEINEKIYMSLPAFLHKYCYMKEEKVSELDFVIDISIFRKGRGGANNSDVGTLAGFIKK